MRLYKSILVLSVVGIYLVSCSSDSESDREPDEIFSTVNLRWYSGSFDRSVDDMKTGLTWALSFLGANLEENSFDQAIAFGDNNIFSLDVTQLGFSDKALEAMQIIITRIRNHSSYQQNDYIDLGRFVMLTLNSSNHYFRITNVPPTLSEFIDQYRFEGKQVRVINSSISKVQRLIDVAEAESISDIAYFSAEGSGSLQDGSFQMEEFETMDIMENGQLRFALYDQNGDLKPAANSVLTNAGKPAKCLWCHETAIQPFFRPDPVLDGDGFLSRDDFLNIRASQMDIIDHYRSELSGDVNFENRQDHSFMEHIYIDFMEPSAEVLSEEWSVSVESVLNMLEGLQTHTQEEFGFENLYDRRDVDRLAPFEVLQVPKSARESSTFEPNYF